MESITIVQYLDKPEILIKVENYNYKQSKLTNSLFQTLLVQFYSCAWTHMSLHIDIHNSGNIDFLYSADI